LVNEKSESESSRGDGAVEESDAGEATRFMFEHKIFQIPGIRFALAGAEREPVLLMSVGDHEAALSFDAVIKEFNVAPDGADGNLLEQVREGLKYVKDIRHGDTIPREILDGSASWSVDEVHYSRSKNKLSSRIALSARPTDTPLDMPEDLAAFLDQPGPKMWLQSGLEMVGEKIGLGPGRAPTIAEMVDKIARELAYIEGLRDRYECVSEIDKKLSRVADLLKTDRQFVGEVQRAKLLMKPPIDGFREAFFDVDILVRQYVALLKAVDSQIKFIRKTRDGLHQKMLIWDDLIEMWEIDLSAESKEAREAVRFTYRFVATNFPQSQDWF
jgi:hypothetical protein